ncbi:MAG: hypothetical protein AAF902_11795, partial [Chloroflexota bacterium]
MNNNKKDGDAGGHPHLQNGKQISGQRSFTVRNFNPFGRMTKMFSLVVILMFLIACGGAPETSEEPAAEEETAVEVVEDASSDEEMEEDSSDEEMMMAEADLDAVKSYAVGNAANQKAGAEQLLGAAMRYYQLVSEAGFDYEAALASSPPGEIQGLIA